MSITNRDLNSLFSETSSRGEPPDTNLDNAFMMSHPRKSMQNSKKRMSQRSLLPYKKANRLEILNQVNKKTLNGDKRKGISPETGK